jgi:phthiodiolone/phenolphthiodiolone dimycocerosates ketoreductase
VADPDAWLDPFCVAAILGRQTDLLVGTSVTDSVRRQGPDLARTLLTLNNSCRAGFILGIGAGEAESTTPFGYDFSAPTAKFERTLAVIRSLLDTGQMPDGMLGRTGLRNQNPRAQPLLWAAAIGERTLDIVGRYADGWMSMGLNPEQFAEKRGRVFRAAAAAGRVQPTIALNALALFCDSRDHGAAALRAQPLINLILLFAPATLWRRYGLEHPSGPNCRGYPDTIPHALDPTVLREAAHRVPFEMFEEYVLVGNAEEVAERLKPYARAGLDHLVFSDLTSLSFDMQEAGRLLVAGLGRLRPLLRI